MDQTTVVQFHHATKKVGRRTLVSDLTFEIPAGEVFGFLGPNGAGKTTTIRMMVGLVKISEGDIFIKGCSISRQFKQAIRHVGAIVENPDLYKYLTGWQNLKHYARMASGIAKSRIEEVVELVGLKDRIHDRVGTYSLGMRQRLGIAQALLHRPSLLVLDEPTNGLDPAGIHELRHYLKRLAHEDGVAVFVSSHLLSEMQLMCARVGVLQHGKLVRIETMQDFVRHNGSSRICVTIEPSSIEHARRLLAALSNEVLPASKPGQLLLPLSREDIPAVSKLLMDAGIPIYSIGMQERTLEDRFLEITEDTG